MLGQETGTINFWSNLELGSPTNAYGVGVLCETGTINFRSNLELGLPTNAYGVRELRETGTINFLVKS